MFKIGEKVVCINPIDDLVKYEIYTVYEIVHSNFGIGVLLVEVSINPNFIGFNANRFRKLDYQFTENLLAKISEGVLILKN